MEKRDTGKMNFHGLLKIDTYLLSPFGNSTAEKRYRINDSTSGRCAMTIMTKEEKQELIAKFRQSDNDTGSSEVQIAILTKKINALTDHLRVNKRDHSSRRGLMMMVSRRRSLLDYLKEREPQRYVDIIQALGIRK